MRQKLSRSDGTASTTALPSSNGSRTGQMSIMASTFMTSPLGRLPIFLKSILTFSLFVFTCNLHGVKDAPSCALYKKVRLSLNPKLWPLSTELDPLLSLPRTFTLLFKLVSMILTRSYGTGIYLSALIHSQKPSLFDFSQLAEVCSSCLFGSSHSNLETFHMTMTIVTWTSSLTHLKSS